MYDTAGVLPVSSLQSGVYVVSGDVMGETYGIVRRLLGHGCSVGDAGVLVSTDRGLGAVRRDVSDVLVGSDLRVVDCATGEEDRETVAGVSYVSSPNDLTGIGMRLSAHLDAVGDGPVRVGVNSLSTLLLYSDYRRVFRFTHVITNRLRASGTLGLFVVHPGSHDDPVVSNFLSVADGVVEVRETESGTEVRITEGGDATAWQLL